MDQDSRPKAARLRVGMQLALEPLRHFRDRFWFYNHLSVHDKVSAEIPTGFRSYDAR
jgi:hypothetical protein